MTVASRADGAIPGQSRRRFLIVRNARAGHLRPKLLSQTVAALARAGAVVTVYDTENAHDLAVIKKQVLGSADAIVAAGGDGTVRALAKTIGTDLPIGVIPVGTGNVLAHEIGLPRDPGALAHVLMNGPGVTIDGARANGEPFFLMAGAGLDGAIVRALDVPTKQRIGRAAYTLPTLRALARPPDVMHVRLDGADEYRVARWVIVTRVQRYGGAFTLTRRASLLQPGFHAVLFQPRSQMQFLRQLVSLAMGRLDTAGGVDIVACVRVDVSSDRAAQTQLDGDALGATPFTVETRGPQMRLIVPAAYASNRSDA